MSFTVNPPLPIAGGNAPDSPHSTSQSYTIPMGRNELIFISLHWWGHILDRWSKASIEDKDIESSWPFEMHSGLQGQINYFPGNQNNWHIWLRNNFFKKFYLFIYLFLAVLGLRFCARAFSSCGEQGPLFVAVRGPLTIAASLVVEHRLQTRRLSSCGSQA